MTLEERIAKLEARQDVFNVLIEQSINDRAKLHSSLDELTETLRQWKTSQNGFIAGAGFVIGTLMTGVALGWDWIVQHMK